MDLPKVNAHLHTPFSFSAFRDIDDALDRAVAEKVKVVGINDFYTAEGYEEWADGCRKRGLFPLFGIEFISLNEEDQKAGLRVNDPGNPGRTYISGKGLLQPFKLDEPYASELTNVRNEANKQVEAMCEKLNGILTGKNASFILDIDWIKENLTKGSVRERHLAKALRLKVYENCDDNPTCIKNLLREIFGGKELKSDTDNLAGVENEIRANLLKSGGLAFVPETAEGNYTDFERDLEHVAEQLTERGFHSVEFITTRNDMNLLENYASYLHDQGFIVTLGSEHNSPSMEPIELFARNQTPLSDKLIRINYEGACVIAAHQHLVTQGLSGYVDEQGNADRSKRGEFVKLGDELIRNRVGKQ